MRTVHLHTGALPIIVSMDVEEAAKLVHLLDSAITGLKLVGIYPNTIDGLQEFHDDILVAVTVQKVKP